MVWICTGEVGCEATIVPGPLREFEVKRVHVVTDRMIFGNIQRFEIVVGRFNLRAFCNRKADGEEDILDFLHHLADEVVRAQGTKTPGNENRPVLRAASVPARDSAKPDQGDSGINMRAQRVQCSSDRAFQFGVAGFSQ